MAKISDVLSKLNTLKSSSPSGGSTFFTPVENATSVYFITVRGGKNVFNSTVEAVYNDIYRRTVQYEHIFPVHYPEDYPVGYDNFWECFYNFAEIIDIDSATFNTGWYYGPGEIEGEEVLQGNTYLDEWLNNITTWTSIGVSKLQTLIDWCEGVGPLSYLVAIIEDRGKLLYAKPREEIAHIIYTDRHLKQIITDFEVDAYVASYE